MAPLLGGAIETSEIYENTTRKLAVLSTLSGLVQSVRGGRYLDEALRTLAETTVRVTASDLCVLILAEPGSDRLSIRGYTPGEGEEPGAVVAGILNRRPWEHLAAISSPSDLGLAELAPPHDAPEWAGAHMAAPLVAAGEQLGLMMCYGAALRQYGDDDVALLNIIANQAAITVKNSQLADLLAERDVPARLFRDLVQGPEDGEDLVRRRASLLGCDLSRPHVPAVLDLASVKGHGEQRGGQQTVGRLVQRWLAETYPGSIVHVEAAVLALIQLPEEDDGSALPGAFEALQPLVERELGLRLAGGLGRACQSVSDYRRGFAEARDALRVAKSLRHASVLHFDALGAARYLTRIPPAAGDELRDRYQECIERVAAYDARKGTTLLHTLDVYLSCGGSIARTAEHLYVHRNTLVQRLEKLHDLLGLDPHDSDHWLALHIALALRQLQEP
jgi:sugar diacid utilization regulator